MDMGMGMGRRSRGLGAEIGTWESGFGIRDKGLGVRFWVLGDLLIDNR